MVVLVVPACLAMEQLSAENSSLPVLHVNEAASLLKYSQKPEVS